MLGHLVASHHDGDGEAKIYPPLPLRRVWQFLADLFRRF
jgi:hypothetical protein